MNHHYNQQYTKEQIQQVLEIIKDCIRNDQFVIERNENRLENIRFIQNYNLSSAKQKDILLGIVTEDFCHSLRNKKPGYEHETLYVFCPQVYLYNIDSEKEFVDVYIKFNILDYEKDKRVIIISLHKLNRSIGYLFKK